VHSAELSHGAPTLGPGAIVVDSEHPNEEASRRQNSHRSELNEALEHFCCKHTIWSPQPCSMMVTWLMHNRTSRA